MVVIHKKRDQSKNTVFTGSSYNGKNFYQIDTRNCSPYGKDKIIQGPLVNYKGRKQKLDYALKYEKENPGRTVKKSHVKVDKVYSRGNKKYPYPHTRLKSQPKESYNYYYGSTYY